MRAAAEMRRAAAAILRPPEREAIEPWAERSIVLPEGPRAGEPFSLRGFEYQREIWTAATLAAFGDRFSRVVIPKGGRTGHTTCFCFLLPLYTVLVLRRPAMVVQPRDSDASGFARDLVKLIRASPRVAAAFPRLAPADELTSAHGVTLRTTFSSSRDELTRVGAALIALDEFDRLVGCGGLDLAPWNTADMAEARVREYRQKARIDLGTPELPGRGIMERYDLSSMGRYHLRCPHCDRWQSLEFPGIPAPASEPHYDGDGPGNLAWDEEVTAEQRAVNARHQCRLCLKAWNRGARAGANATGRWVHAYGDRPVRGFHVSQLYVVNVSSQELADARVRSRVNPRAERELFNQVCGLGYEPRAGAMTEEAVRARVAPQLAWKTPPPGTYALTAGIDIQGDREPWTYRYLVAAWANDRMHAIEWGEVHGDAAAVALLRGRWGGRPLRRALIDAGGKGAGAAARLQEAVGNLDLSVFTRPKTRAIDLVRPSGNTAGRLRHWIIHPDLMLDRIYLEKLGAPPGQAGGLVFAVPPDDGLLDQLATHFAGITRQPYRDGSGEELWCYVKRRPIDVDYNYCAGLADVAEALGDLDAPPRIVPVSLPQPGAMAGGVARRALAGRIAPRRRVV